MTASRPDISPGATRALGVVGMLGGIGVLLAFVVEIPPALNTARIVLSLCGAIAIGVALYETPGLRIAAAGSCRDHTAHRHERLVHRLGPASFVAEAVRR